MHKTAYILLAIALAASACTVGPDYVPPTLATPETWSATAEEGIVFQPTDLSRWWTTLGDPQLDSLIDRAVHTNLDLRIAEARVREARALRGIAASEGLPQVDANGLY